MSWVTPERDALIRELWPTVTSSREIRQRIEALPGEPVPSLNRLSARAAALGLRRPPEIRQGAERPIVWTGERIDLLCRLNAENAPMDAMIEALNRLPGRAVTNRKMVYDKVLDLGLARNRARTWPPERVAYLREHWAKGTEPRVMLAALNAMPGRKLTRLQALYDKTRVLGLSRPEGFRKALAAKQAEAKPGHARKRARADRAVPPSAATPSPRKRPNPEPTPIAHEDEEAQPDPLLARIYDYAITRRLRVNLVGTLTQDEFRLINQARDCDGLGHFPSPFARHATTSSGDAR